MLKRFLSADGFFVLIVAAAIAAGFYLIDFLELWYALTIQYGWWFLDELIYVAAGLFVAGTMLAVRRYYDLKRAVRDIKETEQDLQKKTATLDLMREAASLANEADTAEEALQSCLQQICDYAGWSAAHLYFQDKGRFIFAKQGVWYPKEIDSKRVEGKNDKGVKNSFAFPVFVDRQMEEAVLEYFTEEQVIPDNHIIKIVYNITNQIARVIERQQAEEKREASHRYLKDLLDHIADPIFVKDEQYRWIDGNKAFWRIMGQAKEELVGKSDHDLFPKVEADVFREYDKHTFETGDVSVNEELITLEEGDTRILSTKKAVFSNEEGEKVLVGVIRDITEQKATEQALREKTKMESLGALAGGLAHEINNALQPVLGLSEVLRDRFCGKDEKAVQYMTTIHNNAMHARNIVRDVLAFARKENKKKSYLGFVELIEEALQYTDEFLPAEVSVDVVYSSENLDLCQIWADHTGVLQVMANLFKNATHAMNGEGRITVSLSLEDIHKSKAQALDIKPGAYAHIVVADEGCGMDKKALEHLFEPFYTTKSIGVGTGLGLSAVYGIIKDWGGAISVESHVNKGTKFNLHVPANQKEIKKGKTVNG